MAQDKQMISTMKIEDIHAIERFMFWFERVAILIQMLVFPGPRYLLAFTALLFVATNTIFIALSVERQFIRRFFFEPDAIFYIERLAILLQILHLVVPGGFGYFALIGLVVLVFTNFVMINRYHSTGEQEKQLSSKNSVSSETNTTLNGKETVKDDDKEKKQKKAIIKDRLLKKLDLGAGLLEDDMRALVAPAQNSSFNHRVSLLVKACKVEASSVNSNPLETSSSNAMAFEKVDDDFREPKVACSGPVKTEEYELLEIRKKSYVDVAMADEVKEVKEDQKEGATDLEADNQGWEKVQNDLSGKPSVAVESSVDQKKTDEAVEAKDEQAATGNYKSDDDSSWEKVRNTVDETLRAEIESSDEKKADESEEQKEEDTIKYDSDEISWNEGQNFLSRPLAPISSAEISLKWDQGIRNLTERLETATQRWQQYEESCNRLKERVEGSETDEQLRDMETDRRKWNIEKEYIQNAIESLERERQRWNEVNNALNERIDALNERNSALNERNSALNERTNALHERINSLNTTIDNADENAQYCQTLAHNYAELCLRLAAQVCENHSRYQNSINDLMAERADLSSKLAAATASAESYKVKCSRSEEHCEYYKACFEDYEEKCCELKAENDNLSSELSAETSLAERYRTIVQELEDRYRSLEAEKTDLTANFSAARASAELYRGLLHDLVD